MKRISDKNLELITGGSINNITSGIINAFVNVIKLLIDAGNTVGDGIRRVTEGEICPLR